MSPRRRKATPPSEDSQFPLLAYSSETAISDSTAAESGIRLEAGRYVALIDESGTATQRRDLSDWTLTLNPDGSLSFQGGQNENAWFWSSLIGALEMDRAAVLADERATAVLGWFADQKVVPTAKMLENFDTPLDWLAFSRLQRARLIDDLGALFVLSKGGHLFLHDVLGNRREE